MVTVPAFLLRRLYVRGSLRNTDEGVQFQLENKLGAGYARKMLPLTLDDRSVPPHLCTFSVNGRQFAFSQVSNETPFTLDYKRTTTITISGESLSEGPHTIGMAFEVAGLGVLRFDFTDVPSNG